MFSSIVTARVTLLSWVKIDIIDNSQLLCRCEVKNNANSVAINLDSCVWHVSTMLNVILNIILNVTLCVTKNVILCVTKSFICVPQKLFEVQACCVLHGWFDINW